MTITTMNLEESADFLKVSSDTMRDLADSGTIPGAKVGKQWVFRTIDLDSYLAEVIARQTEERRAAFLCGKSRVKTEATGVREKRREIPKLPELPAAA